MWSNGVYSEAKTSLVATAGQLAMSYQDPWENYSSAIMGYLQQCL